MLSSDDKKDIGRMILDNVVEALTDVVVPRLDNIETRLDGVETRLGNLEEEVHGLGVRVEMVENDMAGAKMTLRSMEKKLNSDLDTSLMVKDHDRRIVRLEKVII